MSPSVRKHSAHVLLALSLLLNVATIGYFAKMGGWRRLLVRMDLAQSSVPREEFQKEGEALYRKFPNTPAEIVFVGDSLVRGGPWSEYYSEIHNRGIGGETTSGLLARIDEVTESRPRKIFLLLGTNDLAMAVPVAQLIRNYRTLLGRIRKDSPETMIHVIGLLPVNPAIPGELIQTNAQIAGVNEQLKKLVDEFPGVKFLDLSPNLLDGVGKPRVEFYSDNVHLNYDGYLALREPLAPFVAGDKPWKVTEAGPKP
jgi:lysophospholipase L1-like esterase